MMRKTLILLAVTLAFQAGAAAQPSPFAPEGADPASVVRTTASICSRDITQPFVYGTAHDGYLLWCAGAVGKKETKKWVRKGYMDNLPLPGWKEGTVYTEPFPALTLQAPPVPMTKRLADGLWRDIDRLFLSWGTMSDTVFVVSGTIPPKDGQERRYYKSVLRKHYLPGLKDEKWDACTVVFDDRDYDVSTLEKSVNLLKRKSVSLAELERLTGLTFFPFLKERLTRHEYTRFIHLEPSLDEWWWVTGTEKDY